MIEIATELRQMIQAQVPAARGEGLGLEVPLGPGGLGLDSVAIVMLLLECEARWGVSFPAEMLEQPMTLARMATHLDSHCQA